jgi:hypothetical protein
MSWSGPEGDVLLSGSDDRKIILWQWQSGWKMRPTSTISTEHVGNIFGVKMLPGHPMRVASGAMDGRVYLHSGMEAGPDWQSTLLLQHNRPVKSVDVDPSNPFLIFSAAEDGNVCQVDTREAGCRAEDHSSSRPCFSVEQSALVSLRFLKTSSFPSSVRRLSEFSTLATPAERCHCVDCRLVSRLSRAKALSLNASGCGKALRAAQRAGVGPASLAAVDVATVAMKHSLINPLSPNYMLVAAGDPFLRVYDRRMLPPLASRSGGGGLHPSACHAQRNVLRFAPLHGTADALLRGGEDGALPRMVHVTRADWDCGAVGLGGASSAPGGLSAVGSGTGRHILGNYHGDGIFVFDTGLADMSPPVAEYSMRVALGAEVDEDGFAALSTDEWTRHRQRSPAVSAPHSTAAGLVPRALVPSTQCAVRPPDSHPHASADLALAGEGEVAAPHPAPRGMQGASAPGPQSLCVEGERLKTAGNDAFRAGRTFAAATCFATAVMHAEQCCRQPPPKPGNESSTGDSCSASGVALLHTNRAIAMLRRASPGDASAAVEECLQALAADPHWWKAQARLARALKGAGKLQAALQVAEAFLSDHAPQELRHAFELPTRATHPSGTTPSAAASTEDASAGASTAPAASSEAVPGTRAAAEGVSAASAPPASAPADKAFAIKEVTDVRRQVLAQLDKYAEVDQPQPAAGESAPGIVATAIPAPMAESSHLGSQPASDASVAGCAAAAAGSRRATWLRRASDAATDEKQSEDEGAGSADEGSDIGSEVDAAGNRGDVDSDFDSPLATAPGQSGIGAGVPTAVSLADLLAAAITSAAHHGAVGAGGSGAPANVHQSASAHGSPLHDTEPSHGFRPPLSPDYGRVSAAWSRPLPWEAAGAPAAEIASEAGAGSHAPQPELAECWCGGGALSGAARRSHLSTRLAEYYTGAPNMQTDIKEACFWWPVSPWQVALPRGRERRTVGKGGFVVAGSDTGHAIVFDRATGAIVAAIAADDDICNVVQPHPSLPILATSGIESAVRLWTACGASEGDGSEAPPAAAGSTPLPHRGAAESAPLAPLHGSGAPPRCVAVTDPSHLEQLWKDELQPSAANAGGFGVPSALLRSLFVAAGEGEGAGGGGGGTGGGGAGPAIRCVNQ